MKRFEEIIQEKINTFEYPYEENAWENFLRKYTLHKWTRRVVFSSIAIIVSSAIIYFVTLDTKNTATPETQAGSIIQQSNLSEQLNADNQLCSEHDVKQPEKAEHTPHQTVRTTTTNDKNLAEISNQPIISNENNEKNYLQEENVNYSVNISIQQGCVPFTTSFSINNLPESASCIWNFGDGSISYENNPTYTYKKPGKYKVSVKIILEKPMNKQLNLGDNLTVQVFPKPIALMNVKQEANHLIFENQSKQYSSFYWHFGDSIITEDTWKYSPNKSGKYRVKLIAENQYGCKDTAVKSVDFTYLMPVQLADAFTPDGDGVNDLFGPQVLDYESYQFSMQIYNKTGRLVFEAKGSPVWWDGTDVNNRQICSPDVFFYKIIAVDKLGNKQEFSGKIQLIR